VIPPSSVVVIEGVGATRTAWRDRLALRIWIEVPRPVRRMRGVARDGMELAGFWDDWMAVEDRYAAAERPSSYADLRIDGDPSVSHDAQREFVVL
jgi:uridine kinase